MNGNYPTYRFYISESSSLTYEVFPLNFLASTLNDTKEPDNAYYRRTFNGSLLFGTNSTVIDDSGATRNRKDDWTFFYSFKLDDPCAKLYFHIHRSDMVDPYWEGYFSVTDGVFDIDKCTFEVTPIADDEYEEFLDDMNNEYNILAVSTVVTTRALKGVIDVTYDRNRWLIDVIEYLATQALPGVTISSTFFSAANNPATLNANQLKYVTIAQKSDIVRPDSNTGATEAYMSWNQLMNILWTMFQVKWDYVAATDTIRVEHISFWTQAAGLDLTNQVMCTAMNKYEYLKTQMPKYEWIKFMEALQSDFLGLPIWYDSKCVDQNSKTNNKVNSIDVTTDLEHIINYPLEISDDGFVILANYLSAGAYYVRVDLGDLSDNVKLNNALSVANLQNRYFRHNRVLGQGYMNSVLTTFWSTQKNIHQELYAAVSPTDSYDPNNYITTELGTTYLGGVFASVQNSELRPNDVMKFSLVYGDIDVANTGVPDGKYILVYEVKGSGKTTYYAVCSEAVGAAVTLTVQITVEDEDGVTCDSAVTDLDIGAGGTTGNCEIVWCTPDAKPPLCIVVLIPDNTEAEAQGFTVYWEYDLTAHC
jgi:hypothetical protein